MYRLLPIAIVMMIFSQASFAGIRLETQAALSCYNSAASYDDAEDFDVSLIVCMRNNISKISRNDCRTLASTINYEENNLIALALCR